MAYKRKHVKEKFRPKPGKLLDQVREVMHYHHYAIRTEKTDIKWILDYIRFNGTRHPQEMGKPEIERFLSHLAVNRNVSPATQNQAFNAILFLSLGKNTLIQKNSKSWMMTVLTNPLR